MTDQSKDGNVETEPETGENEDEENEEEENEEEEYELEGLMSREEGANVLRRLADGVESASVELGREEGPVSVPEQFDVEVEYEEGQEEAELEVELEWSMVDGEAISTEEDEDDGTDTEASGAKADDGE